MKFKLLGSAATILGLVMSLAADPALAIRVDPFPNTGEGGEIHDHSFSVGPGGSVFELEAYLHVAGSDLNGADLGTSGELGNDLLSNFDIAFSAALSDGDTDITLTYAIEKAAGGAQQVTFLSFLDAEIDVIPTTWYGEYATTGGALAAGQNFEVDEPGSVSGDILDNIFNGDLDGTNALGELTPDDVSIAMSLDLGLMDVGDIASVEVMISEDGDHVGGFWITQADTYPITGTEITFSAWLQDSSGWAEDSSLSYAEPDPQSPSEPDPTPVSMHDPPPVSMPDPTPVSIPDPTPVSTPDLTAAIPEPSSALVFAVGVLLTTGAIRNRR